MFTAETQRTQRFRRGYASIKLSAPPLRPLRLCGEYSALDSDSPVINPPLNRQHGKHGERDPSPRFALRVECFNLPAHFTRARPYRITRRDIGFRFAQQTCGERLRVFHLISANVHSISKNDRAVARGNFLRVARGRCYSCTALCSANQRGLTCAHGSVGSRGIATSKP